MVGTRKLVRLLAHAEAADAKVVLVGDPCQLPEIDAGGAFRGLRARLGASHLTENRRQHHAWERDALAELRAGDADRALDAYLGHGRVHHAATEHDAPRSCSSRSGSTPAPTARTCSWSPAALADVDDLNRRARRRSCDRGDLGADQVVLGGRGFTEGDEVLALRNDYRARCPQRHPRRHRTDRHRPARADPRPPTRANDVERSRSTTPPPATSPTATPPPSTRPRAPPSTAASSSLDDTTTREHTLHRPVSGTARQRPVRHRPGPARRRAPCQRDRTRPARRPPPSGPTQRRQTTGHRRARAAAARASARSAETSARRR